MLWGVELLSAQTPNASTMLDELPQATAAVLLVLGGPCKTAGGSFAEAPSAVSFIWSCAGLSFDHKTSCRNALHSLSASLCIYLAALALISLHSPAMNSSLSLKRCYRSKFISVSACFVMSLKCLRGNEALLGTCNKTIHEITPQMVNQRISLPIHAIQPSS